MQNEHKALKSFKKKVITKAFHRESPYKALLLSALALPFTAGAYADDASIEEVTVTGVRQVIRSSIDIKRSATTIVDGLSASDIGDLPALSIGEALETITGASSHRENGGATEISIRGLGPFLGATTFNGREATNGSGDRSVNFSQFPSELMSKLEVYKTQDASLIEGGVAGLISLETLKPLDYNKQRFQLDLKGNYNPDQQNIKDSEEGDLGFRGTASFVDQFEFDNGGALGVSLGIQRSDTSQPEAEVRSSSPSGSSIYACINDPSVTNEGFYNSSDRDCEDQSGGSSNQGYQTDVDPSTGLAESDGLAYAFAPSSRGYRQNDTSEERDAYFIALQWQPNDKWDINFDSQISERVQAEQRHDLNFANQKRSTGDVTAPGLVTTDSGSILEWIGETAIESNSEVYSRTEDYKGFGLNVAHAVSERLTVSADLSFSETTREELQISLRTQSDNQDIYNESTAGGYRPLVQWDRYSGIPQYTITDFDVTDHTLFSDEYRARIDSDVDRTNTITAFRADFDLKMEGDFVTSIEGGMRFSELEYLNLGATRTTTSNLDDSSQDERDAIAAMNQACANASFPESGFLSSERSGDLITIIDSDTGESTSGTGNSWATFDTRCITSAILDFHGDTFAYPDQERESPSTTDVTETTTSAFVMVNFDTSFADHNVRGNFGLRVVNTEVDSVAYRTQYEILSDDDGFLTMQTVADADLERVSAGDSYTEFLPSFNAVSDLSDELVLRGGLFKGISRADPSDLGYNRSFALSGSADITDPNDLITNVSGSGNPETDPLTSWNADVSLEWYPDPDSILAVGVYYKKFTGGFEQVRTTESFMIDGQAVNADFTITQTNEDTSDLYGVEITGSHRFSNLPGYLSGLGVKASYNYANSDFEFEDSNYGSVTIPGTDGSVYAQTAGIIAPGNVPGFSKHVFSGQVYYQIGKLDLSAIYKYRSEYFQPYTSNGTRLRFVGDVGVWEARASYKLTDNIKLSLSAINLGDEPKKQYFYTKDNLGEVNSYGSRVFFGVSMKY
jgi:TonB-dependent receptor